MVGVLMKKIKQRGNEVRSKIECFLKPRSTWENVNENNGRTWRSPESLTTSWKLEMWARDEGNSQS